MARPVSRRAHVRDDRHLPLYGAGSIDVPFVISGFDEEVDRETHWSEHSHPTHELVLNRRGASVLHVGARSWTVTPTIGLWIPAGTPHTARMPAGTAYRAAHFSIAWTTPLAARPVAVEITPLLRLLLDRLADTTLTAASRETTERMVLDVLEPFERALLVLVPESPILRPLVTAVLADPADPRTLEAWSVQLGVTGRTLTRYLQQETGLGFNAWVSSVRAQRAATALTAGESAEDVARSLGYRSVSAFGVAFKRATGLTPGAFRQRDA